MSIENFKKTVIVKALPKHKAERLEATKVIVDHALTCDTYSGAVAASLVLSMSNNLTFNLQDLIYLDPTRLHSARVMLVSIESHQLYPAEWLDEGGYDGSEAYWAIRDKWETLFTALRQNKRLNAIIER